MLLVQFVMNEGLSSTQRFLVGKATIEHSGLVSIENVHQYDGMQLSCLTLGKHCIGRSEVEEIFKHKNRIVMFAVTFLEYTLTLNILSI